MVDLDLPLAKTGEQRWRRSGLFDVFIVDGVFIVHQQLLDRILPHATNAMSTIYVLSMYDRMYPCFLLPGLAQQSFQSLYNAVRDLFFSLFSLLSYRLFSSAIRSSKTARLQPTAATASPRQATRVDEHANDHRAPAHCL